MNQKIALVANISQKTALRLHRYLMDFSDGTHRLLWSGDRAYIEVECPRDAELIQREFPRLMRDGARYTGATFPW
ncbi:hypothetical protein HMH01_16830 [Halovulum dunhuangense]|uniref:Uncharacterized protein n=1 Tax=Halovulum dunhuangense TaxID=1505036 RepID=A0A849L7J1_9RHOB|nr:hypothetical protein [Halovulum dunhuangense]NNU82104.1 hypothetical protein [Halovulum dunhuangense]